VLKLIVSVVFCFSVKMNIVIVRHFIVGSSSCVIVVVVIPMVIHRCVASKCTCVHVATLLFLVYVRNMQLGSSLTV